MRIHRIFSLIFAGCLFLLGSVAEAKIAIIVSKNIKLYVDSANAVEKYLPRQEIKKYIFDSSNRSSIQEVIRKIRSESPKIIVAVGAKAASESLKAFGELPIVHLKVVNPEKLGLLNSERVHGIHWSCSAKTLAKTINELLPQAKRVGVISSLSKRAWKSKIDDFKDHHLELIVSSIDRADELPESLRRLHKKVDVLWMGSDSLLASKTSYSVLNTYCIRNNLPFIIPIRLAPNSGVLASITVTPDVSGFEASKLVRKLLKGEKIGERMVYADQTHLSLDLKTANSLGKVVSESMRRSAAEVYK